jgi:hypothetical protein
MADEEEQEENEGVKSMEDAYKEFDVKPPEEEETTEDAPEEEEATEDAPEEEEATEDAPAEEEAPEASREIPKSKIFDEDPASIDSVMREALTDVDTVVVSMDDRTRYLKAVLNDVPVKLKILLCGDAIDIEIRSRSAWEQSVLYAAVKKDQEEGLVSDLSSVIIQLQKYGCSLMLQSLNGDPLEFLTLKQEDGINKCVELLRKHMKEHIEALSMPKWTIFLNALRTFETKIARMGTECLNENFWKPAG